MTGFVMDLETGPGLGPIPPAPEEFLQSGIRDNWRPETVDEYRAKNSARWPTEYAKKASLDWRLGRVVAIGFCDGNETYTDAHPTDEHRLVTNAWKALADFSGPLVGFNIKGFDIPWLVGRSLVLGITPSRYLSNIPPWKTESVLDLMDLLNGKDRVSGRGLEDYAKLLQLPHQPIGSGADVAGWLEKGQMDKVTEHLEADLWTTWDLYQRCRKAFGV